MLSKSSQLPLLLLLRVNAHVEVTIYEGGSLSARRAKRGGRFFLFRFLGTRENSHTRPTHTRIYNSLSLRVLSVRVRCKWYAEHVAGGEDWGEEELPG